MLVARPGATPRMVGVAIPDPGAGSVRIRVEAASLNYSDLIRSERSGPYPFIPGAEVAGTVDAVGPDSEVAIGTRVVAILPERGGCAEYAVADAAHLLRTDLEAGTAAAAFLTFLTAWLAVGGCDVGPGDDVLVHAAGGGVGSAAIQLVCRRGARTAGLASTATKRELCRRLGAHVALDNADSALVSKVREWAPDGVAAILDGVGGRTWPLNRAVLRRGGSVALFGFAGGEQVVLDVPTDVIAGELRLFGFAASSRDHLAGRVAAFHEAVLPLLEAGDVAPVIADRLPLDRIAEGYRAMGDRSLAGKIVLIP